MQATDAYGASGWTNSAPNQPAYDPYPATDLQVNRADGELLISWTQCDVTLDWCSGGSPVTGYLINVSDNGGATWTRAKTLTSYTSGSVVTIDSGIVNSKAYQVSVGIENRVLPAWTNASVGPVALTVSNITATGATLHLANYSGQWWYKADVGPDSTCQGPVAAGAGSESLTGLTESQSCTYSAYSGDLLETAAQFTTPPNVSNLFETSAQGFKSTTGGAWLANGFTTDTSNSGGYTLDRVVVPLSGNSNLTIRLFATASGTTNPGASLVTLSASVGADANGDYTFTCSGSGCDLSVNTRYFLVLNSDSGYSHTWEHTESDNETNAPSGRGWTIENTYRSSTTSGTGWADGTTALKFTVRYRNK